MASLSEAQKRFIQKLSPGQRASGVVKNFTDFGAFVSIGVVNGLLHNKNIRWGRVEDPQHHLRKGQKLEVLILEVDALNGRVSLGLKQLTPDPWERFCDKYVQGDSLAATVLSVRDFGLIVEIVSGIESLVHKSEIPDWKQDSFNEGDVFEMIISELDFNDRKLKLTFQL